MRCQAHSWLGVGKVYEGCDVDLRADDPNSEQRLLQRLDGAPFNDWKEA